jgi:diacylglycerol kinase family enzyme
MAADAALVRYFEKSPVRGILPYVLAAAYEMFEYKPQSFELVLDGRERLRIDEVLVFTVANLTQFGGGARIAPQALADDGLLEMIALPRAAAANVLEGVPRLFNGTIDRLPGIVTRRFHRLDVRRRYPSVIQVDGEAVDTAAEVSVRVRRKALNVLVPSRAAS